MSIILFDNAERNKLNPLNSCSATAGLRLGIFTIEERWANLTANKIYIHTAGYLSHLYAGIPAGSHIWADAAVLADTRLTERILLLKEGEAVADDKGLIAGRKFFTGNDFSPARALQYFETIYEYTDAKRLEYPWQIFQWNDAMVRADFEWVTSNKQSQPLPQNNQYINPGNIFIEEGAAINFAVINAATGPVYIGKNTVILEGAAIRGPFALCENAVVKMGAKIYGATTLGPHCIGGGEIKNVVMQGFSNKAHDGYLGDSVIGNWCNLGAGSTGSNVKNTAGNINMWNAFTASEIPAGLKCGVIMGDYSRTAINSAINTGTVIGVCSNVFGAGLLPKNIPSFTWGALGTEKYKLDKAFEHIANWKKMKGHSLNDAETKVLAHIFEQL